MGKGRLGTAYCATSAPQLEATLRISRKRGNQADGPILERLCLLNVNPDVPVLLRVEGVGMGAWFCDHAEL